MTSNRLINLTFWGGIIFHLLYIWTLDIYLTQDGPSHLYNAELLKTFLLHPELISQGMFEINASLFPNWTGTVVLSLLLMVFPPIIAEKILVAFLVVGFAYSGLLLVKELNPKAGYLGLCLVFLGQNFFLVYGFYNFIFSLILLNCIILFHLKNGNRLSWKYFISESLLLVLLFFTHPVALVLGLLYLGVDVLVTQGVHLKRHNHIKWDVLFFYAGMVVPSVALFLIYFLNGSGSGVEQEVIVNNLGLNHAVKLFTLYFLNAFGTVEFILNIGLGLLIFLSLGLLYKSLIIPRLIAQHAGFLAVFVFCMFIYFFMSDSLAGGTFLTRRITLIIYLFAVFIIAAFINKPRFVRAQTVFLFFLFCALCFFRYPKQQYASQIASRYLEAQNVIKRGSTFIPLKFSGKGTSPNEEISPRISLFEHISGYLALRSESETLDNYEANTSYFPIKWKEHTNPYMFIDATLADNPWDFNHFEANKFKKLAGVSLDYLVFFGDTRLKEPDAAGFKNVVAAENLELVFSNDMVRVYGKTASDFNENVAL